MKKLNIIFILFLSLNSFAQEVNDKIKLFENDLNHWNKSKRKKWSLKERMAFYDVNAVSIAVIKDYKVEWIKAYGVLTPIKQEYSFKFRLLIMRLIYSLKLDVYSDSIFPLV
jgi:hypothetical protein